MPLTDAEALTMAETLVVLLEKGDALAAAVLEGQPHTKEPCALCQAAHAWRATRVG